MLCLHRGAAELSGCAPSERSEQRAHPLGSAAPRWRHNTYKGCHLNYTLTESVLQELYTCTKVYSFVRSGNIHKQPILRNKIFVILSLNDLSMNIINAKPLKWYLVMKHISLWKTLYIKQGYARNTLWKAKTINQLMDVTPCLRLMHSVLDRGWHQKQHGLDMIQFVF